MTSCFKTHYTKSSQIKSQPKQHPHPKRKWETQNYSPLPSLLWPPMSTHLLPWSLTPMAAPGALTATCLWTPGLFRETLAAACQAMPSGQYLEGSEVQETVRTKGQPVEQATWQRRVWSHVSLPGRTLGGRERTYRSFQWEARTYVLTFQVTLKLGSF